MIEDTLRKLGMAKLEERKLTDEIFDNQHEGCAGDGPITQLEIYFDDSEYGEFPFDIYCKQELERFDMCPKCARIYELVLQRKKVRKRIGTLRGVVTKYAISIASKDIHDQKEDV